MTIVIVLIFIIISLGSAWGLVYYNKTHIISFREAMDLTELPVVTFRIGDRKVNFLLDTGANASVIDERAVEFLSHKELEGTTIVMGIEGNATKAKNISMELYHKDRKYVEDFQVIDMSGTFEAIRKESGVIVNGILGNAFFVKYKYVLDFNDLIAYSKK